MRQSQQEGLIDRSDRELTESAFAFGDSRARDVMTPRPKIDFVTTHASIADAARFAMARGHTRLPLAEPAEGLDAPLGLIHVKDLLEVALERRETPLLGGLLAAVAFAVAGELGDLGANARRGINEIVVWLTAGPLGLSERQIDDTLDRAVEQLRDRSDLIAGGLLALILLFFLLKDGDRIWRWLVELLPGRRRDDVDELARRAWSTLGGYLRGVSAVALIDPLLSAPRSRSSRCRWCCR
jgi:CBS domain-containing protein